MLIFILGIIIPAFQNQTFGQINHDSSGIKIPPTDTSLKNKSPMGALFRSIVIPGWGQFYNGKYFKSLMVFGTETTFITLAVIEGTRRNEHKRNFQNLPQDHPDKDWEFEQFRFYEDRRNLFLWITAGIVFISMFDAYVDAQLYNFDKEEVPDFSIRLIPGSKGGKEINVLFSVKF
ncbi:MAG: DUF5683 domain-containing protein [Candidatus Zixiibacteriota bacterium]